MGVYQNHPKKSTGQPFTGVLLKTMFVVAFEVDSRASPLFFFLLLSLSLPSSSSFWQRKTDAGGCDVDIPFVISSYHISCRFWYVSLVLFRTVAEPSVGAYIKIFF